MSKRKPAAASKRAQSNPKPATARKRGAARAQRNKQEFVRSPKGSPWRVVAGGSTESPIESDAGSTETSIVHDDQKQVDNRARALALEAILQASLPNVLGQQMRDNNPKKGFDFPLPIANLQAYQAKLLEATQANMQFTFEFIQRLATIRSPFEFWAVIAEFTGRRVIMIGKHSKELAAFWRIDAFRELTALPGR